LKLDAKEQDTIRQYLLGQLRQEDSAQLEERLLSDGDFFEELIITEDELIDQYLGGDLSHAERLGFEAHFLAAPERQQKVRFAHLLGKYVKLAAAETAPLASSAEKTLENTVELRHSSRKERLISFWRSRKTIFAYSLAATVLLLVFGASWLILEDLRTPALRRPGNVLTVVLTPGLTRDGGEIKRVLIPAGTESARLVLKLATDAYPNYQAVLVTAEGEELLRMDNLKAEFSDGQNVLILYVESRLLPGGDFQLKLSGVTASGTSEALQSYQFRVVTKLD
jgi:hypothetical protein